VHKNNNNSDQIFFFLLAKSEEANDPTITSNGAVTVDTDNKVN